MVREIIGWRKGMKGNEEKKKEYSRDGAKYDIEKNGKKWKKDTHRGEEKVRLNGDERRVRKGNKQHRKGQNRE